MGLIFKSLNLLFFLAFSDYVLASSDEVSIGENAHYGDEKNSEVMETIQYSLGGIRHCYENISEREDIKPGTIEVQFTILEDGTVSDIQTFSNTTDSEPLADCLNSAVQDFFFDKDLITKKITLKIPYVFDTSGIPPKVSGSGAFYAGLGNFHLGGSFSPKEVSSSFGVGLELGLSSGDHNILVQVYGANAKQGEGGDRHRFAIEEESVSVGYISLLYRYCVNRSFRICFGTGGGVLKLSQSASFESALGSDDRVLGAVPVHASISYSWFIDEDETMQTQYGHSLTFGIDALKTQGIEFATLTLSYGFRFQALQ